MQYKKKVTSDDETNMGSSDIHEVPPFFLCPISLEMMKDPVTLSTGVTYDRESIRQWIFDYGRQTCPVTKQLLAAADVAAGFTPNSTLLRLIHEWHADHPPKTTTTTSSSSNATINEATPTFDFSILPHLANDMRLDQSHQTRTKAVKGINQLVQESDYNKQWLRESDLVYALASLITESEQQELIIASPSTCRSSSTLMEDAMNVLYLLKPPREVMKKIGEDGDGKMIAKLTLVLQRGSYQSRVVSVLLLKHFFKVVNEKYKSNLPPEFFHAMAEILKDQNSSRETMAALSILVELTHYQSNQVKAIEAGLVGVLVELLAESKERRSCELMLGVMEALCSRADGRAAFGAHAAGVAAVAGKLTAVSPAESEAAVKVLVQVCRSERVVEEMVEVGVVGQLYMVVQSEVGRKTKEKAKQLMALNFNVWSKSPCFHSFYFINYH